MLRPDGRWMAFSPPTNVIPEEIPACRLDSARRLHCLILSFPRRWANGYWAVAHGGARAGRSSRNVIKQDLCLM